MAATCSEGRVVHSYLTYAASALQSGQQCQRLQPPRRPWWGILVLMLRLPGYSKTVCSAACGTAATPTPLGRALRA